MFARSIEGHFDSLFAFLWEAGVEPANNHAERTIRQAVLWRKRSLWAPKALPLGGKDSFLPPNLPLAETLKLRYAGRGLRCEPSQDYA